MAPVFLALDEWGGHSAGRQQMRLPVDELWVHHSVTNEDLGVNPTDDAIADFRELDAIGLSRGHGGISYSYAIHPSGVIGEGQGTRIGAHTAVPGHDRNPWSFGVCFIGNFDPASGDDTPTPAAIDAFRWLRDEYLIRNGWLLPGTYPTGGHRDAPGQATGCPGNNLEGRLDDLRRPWTAVPAPTPQEGDAMFYFGEHPTKPGIALGLLVESGVVTCQLEGPPDGYGFPPAAGIWINGGPGVGNGPVPWRRVQPYVLGWLLQTHDDVVNRRYVGKSGGAAGSIDPAILQAAVRAELDQTVLKAR